MKVNFFTWMREGVKQAVLLGVSDAVEEIGMPESDDASQQDLLGSLRSSAALAASGTSGAASRGGGRKRLGRSLKDVGAGDKAA